jgi:hypothetical protein
MPVRKTVLTATATAAAAAAAAAIALPLSSAPAAPSGSFTVQSQFVQRTFHRIDVGRHGNSAGDEFVFSTNLRRDGKAAGRGEYVQTAVDDRYQGISMVISLLLPDGTLELRGSGVNKRPPGLASLPSDDLTIAGGTGAYAGARGVVHVTDGAHKTQTLTVAFDG